MEGIWPKTLEQSTAFHSWDVTIKDTIAEELGNMSTVKLEIITDHWSGALPYERQD